MTFEPGQDLPGQVVARRTGEQRAGDFELSFVMADGDARCEPLSRCWHVPFERVTVPAR